MDTDRVVKKTLSVVLRLAVVGICFFLIFRKLNVADIPTHLKTVYLPLVAVALLAWLSEAIVMAAKWKILLRQKGIDVGYFKIIRILFTSSFLGAVVPSSVGTDAIRIYLVKQENGGYIHATGTLVADRLMAVAALALLSLLAVPVVFHAVQNPRVAWGVMAACGGILVSLALVVSSVAGKLFARTSSLCLGWLSSITGSREDGGFGNLHRLLERISLFLSEVHASVRSLIQAPRRLLLAVFLLNVSLQLLRVVEIHCLFRSIGVTVPVMQELAFVPIILMLSFLPISFFGLGIKEGAFVFFFSQVQVPPSAALTVSLITYPVIFLAILPGGLFLLAGRRVARKDET